MRALKWIGLAAVAGVVVLVVVMVLGKRPEQRPPAAAESAPSTLRPSVIEPAPVTPPPTQQSPARLPVALPTAPRLETVVPEAGGAPVQVVRVSPEQTLAAVNGMAITLKDLMPLPAQKAGTDQVMSVERFEFLLNRAVEREVTFQAARVQGVGLSEAQQQRLTELRGRSEQREPGVFDTVQHDPANVEFEQRDATGLLLQAALAEKAGVPSPHVTATQVQAYYDQHQTEYSALPTDPAQRQRAWEKIDQAIRLKLTPQLQAQHQERLRELLDQLKSSARIDIPTQ